MVIVLVEDDLEDQEFFSDAIRKVCPECSLLTVEHGIEALHLLDKIPIPDLIFTDVNMPIMNGIQLIISLRSLDRFSVVPIVVLSTSASDDIIGTCYDRGATRYLTKPDSKPELEAMVGRIITDYNESSNPLY